jgi:hypothetical protein
MRQHLKVLRSSIIIQQSDREETDRAMAFMTILIADIIATIYIVICLLAIPLLIIALILKVIGKAKNLRILRILGNISLVFGILCAIPLVSATVRIVEATCFAKIDMPDGSEKTVASGKVRKMKELCADGSTGAIEELDSLLDHNECLVYYYDSDYDTILDKGLETGNVDIVKTALAHGARLDDAYKYDHMVYYHNSMELFIRCMDGRTVTASDVEILELLFENGAATTCDICQATDDYSNIFGEAVWMVLYDNDDVLTVTDTELDFIQVFIDNGGSDSGLRFGTETAIYDALYYNGAVMDDNYFALLDMVGK